MTLNGIMTADPRYLGGSGASCFTFEHMWYLTFRKCELEPLLSDINSLELQDGGSQLEPEINLFVMCDAY